MIISRLDKNGTAEVMAVMPDGGILLTHRWRHGNGAGAHDKDNITVVSKDYFMRHYGVDPKRFA